MANYRVLQDITYFPKGVVPSDENLGQRKEARRGDVINDYPDDEGMSPDGLVRAGVLESTTAQAKSADEKK